MAARRLSWIQAYPQKNPLWEKRPFAGGSEGTLIAELILEPVAGKKADERNSGQGKK